MRKFVIRGLQLLEPMFKILNVAIHYTAQVPVKVVTCKNTNRDFFLRGKASVQITFQHPRTL